MSATAGEPEGVTSQTLSRGIRILEVLAARGASMSSPELSTALGIHRSIVYRLLRTLEAHRLVVRDERGLFALGPRLASLAATVERDLQQAAVPALRAAANDLGATCFLVSHDGDAAITLASIEPHRSPVTVAQHPGTTHPLGVGAPGRAILSQLPRSEWPESLTSDQISAVLETATTQCAKSESEVIPGLHSIAVPLVLPGHPPLAIGVAYVALSSSEDEICGRLRQAGEAISEAFGLGR